MADQSEYLKNQLFMKATTSTSSELNYSTTINLTEIRGEILEIIVDYLNHKVIFYYVIIY